MFSDREWNSVVDQVPKVEFFSIGVGFLIGVYLKCLTTSTPQASPKA
jgi:hypothetical protein